MLGKSWKSPRNFPGTQRASSSFKRGGGAARASAPRRAFAAPIHTVRTAPSTADITTTDASSWSCTNFGVVSLKYALGMNHLDFRKNGYRNIQHWLNWKDYICILSNANAELVWCNLSVADLTPLHIWPCIRILFRILYNSCDRGNWGISFPTDLHIDPYKHTYTPCLYTFAPTRRIKLRLTLVSSVILSRSGSGAVLGQDLLDGHGVSIQICGHC